MAGLKAHAVATPAPPATKTVGGTGDDCSAVSRGERPPEGSDGIAVGERGPEPSVTAGETAQNPKPLRVMTPAGRNRQAERAAELPLAGQRRGNATSYPNAVAAARRGVTGGERPAPKSKQRPEEDLQIAVAELLDLGLPQGWRWWHTPNQRGTRKYWEQKLLKALGVKAGIQDVTIVGPDPRLVIIELKSDTGGLSKAQREWRDFYWSIGVPWFLARSVEDVIAACHDAGVPLRVRL